MQSIRAGLLRLARRIGVWLVRRLSRWVATKLITYMELRVADWAERKKWPGRRRRWTAAITWLRANLAKVMGRTAAEFNELADHAEKKLGLPVVAKEAA